VSTHQSTTPGRVDPHDGTPLEPVEPERIAAVSTAVLRARAAQAGWCRVHPAARGTVLREAADAVAARADELAELNHRETGKTRADARGGVDAGVGTLRQYAELGPLHRGRALQGSFGAIDYSIARPRGVTVVITPWNDPVAIACGLIGAALAVGNTVIYKPSERCGLVGRLLGEILAPHLPSDVVQTVSGDGETGRLLCEQPDVDLVAHVGSTETGLMIDRAALATGAVVIRENGGNDSMIVDAGVDPGWAAEQAALGAFANTGQICTSVERIYVHREIADAFVRELVRVARRLNDSGDLGPLVDETMRSIVHAHVVDAESGGATVVTGGRVPAGSGAFYPATVLTDVRDGMRVMTQETFGPVAPVRVVDDFEEALVCAGRDAYGLAATVLTRDMAHAQLAAASLPVGTVKVNSVFGGAPGGSAEPRGASGRGFGYGPELLDEMTTTTVVHLAPPTA
jgi:acyl-CoA reductase-like NAD-dependent aldehyde dehydrogenase